MTDRRERHQQLISQLRTRFEGNTSPIRVKKRSTSNLFRYDGRKKSSARLVDLRAFNQPLYIDTKAKTLEVQGLTTYERIVDFTLPHGLIPLITPELKHITVGGATVGIGIEANSFRYGFVHDGLLEAEVLLPDGRIVVCNPKNEYRDLFAGLANSYGTLGYILRAKIKLRPAKRYVQMVTTHHTATSDFVSTMHQAALNPKTDYIESMMYGKNDLYLTLGTQTDKPQNLKSIYGKNIFYRLLSKPGTICLPTKEFLFRYDPEWFWALPENARYNLFRSLAPRSIRNSGLYTRYVAWHIALRGTEPRAADDQEKLIQDWEVPWKYAQELLDFTFDNLDLDGRPLMATPTQTFTKAPLYPMPTSKLHLNLGSYSFVRRRPNHPAYHHTKIMDGFCFAHEGIKMLYSTTFLAEKDFARRYGSKEYKALKAKYDPRGLAPTLYQKAVQSR